MKKYGSIKLPDRFIPLCHEPKRTGLKAWEKDINERLNKLRKYAKKQKWGSVDCSGAMATRRKQARNADIIWIQTNAMKHKQYYRIIDAARQFKKPVRYFTCASAAKCAQQIVDAEE